MKERIVIYTTEQLNGAVRILEGLDLSRPWDFEIKPYRRNRSKEQNALYWEWVGIIAEFVGETKDEMHEELKEKHLVPLLIQHNEDFQRKVELTKELRRRGQNDIADRFKANAIFEASTTSLNTKQFSEYMNQVEALANGLGITLPQPEPIPKNHE